jgi:hypothetical protein
MSGCIDQESDAYKKGYDIGYTEHNETDYNVCSDYYTVVWLNYKDNVEMFDFSKGYIEGYEDWNRDNETLYRKLEYENKTNGYEDKIVGIMNE